jgi:hypothetical protein
MQFDLDILRRQVRVPVGVPEDDDPDLTTEDVDLFLNFAFWEIADNFPFREKERVETFVTTRGTRDYELPSNTEAVRQVAIVDITTKTRDSLDRMTGREYEDLYNEQETYYSRPTHFVREGCVIKLYPTPDAEYTITIRRWAELGELIEGIKEDPNIPRTWMAALVNGARYHALLFLGDVNRANHYRNHNVASINSTVTKEEKEANAGTQLSGVEVLGREY